MDKLIAIHNRPGSFSDRWIEQCKERGLFFRVINCYSDSVFRDLEGVSVLLWHWHFNEPNAKSFVPNLIRLIEEKGITVYPGFSTCWHYDDKIAQKYILEYLGVNTPETKVFFDRLSCENWILNAEFPSVFKLRCGASSSNVVLLKSREQAMKLCLRAFSKGFRVHPSYTNDYRTRINNTLKKNEFWAKLKKIPRSYLNYRRRVLSYPVERDYFLVQEFLPNNDFDIRITVIGERAFAFRRMVRRGDFRASGSGNIDFTAKNIDLRCVDIAFQVSRSQCYQSMAYDFIYDAQGNPSLVEISYAYKADAVYNAEGYFRLDLTFVEGHFWPQDCILDDLLSTIP